MDLRKLKSILELFTAADIAEMKISSGDENIHIIRTAPQSAVALAPQNATTTHQQTTTKPAETTNAQTTTNAETGTIIPAPMVGTFYRSPSPDRPPFVQVGQRIEKGQTICIIEAMKLMNEISSPASGIVRAIIAENGQPVGFGDRLMILE